MTGITEELCPLAKYNMVNVFLVEAVSNYLVMFKKIYIMSSAIGECEPDQLCLVTVVSSMIQLEGKMLNVFEDHI